MKNKICFVGSITIRRLQQNINCLRPGFGPDDVTIILGVKMAEWLVLALPIPSPCAEGVRWACPHPLPPHITERLFCIIVIRV